MLVIQTDITTDGPPLDFTSQNRFSPGTSVLLFFNRPRKKQFTECGFSTF